MTAIRIHLRTHNVYTFRTIAKKLGYLLRLHGSFSGMTKCGKKTKAKTPVDDSSVDWSSQLALLRTACIVLAGTRFWTLESLRVAESIAPSR